MEPTRISPEVSLDLRIRWLETLLFGNKEKSNSNVLRVQDTKNATLIRGVKDLQERMASIVQNNDGLKRFMDHCASRCTLLLLLRGRQALHS